MYDGFGGQYQPSTPPASTPKKVLRFDRQYVVTMPGILKITELMCNFIGFLVIKISTMVIASIPYNILYWVGIIITLFLLLMYLFHFVEKYDNLPWLKCEFFYCSAMVIAYIVCSIVATVLGGDGYAVGFFGLLATIAYGVDAFLKFKAWRRGLPPQ